jgi:hypothetical protein
LTADIADKKMQILSNKFLRKGGVGEACGGRPRRVVKRPLLLARLIDVLGGAAATDSRANVTVGLTAGEGPTS